MRELEKFYQTKGREELRLRKDSVQYLEFLTAAKYLDELVTENLLHKEKLGKSNYYINIVLYDILSKQAA